jgi:hypothetical protein
MWHEWFIPVLSIITTALTTLATWNLRISSEALKDLTEAVRQLQIEIARHDVRLDHLERRVGDPK